jgi:hypothetical protein
VILMVRFVLGCAATGEVNSTRASGKYFIRDNRGVLKFGVAIESIPDRYFV